MCKRQKLYFTLKEILSGSGLIASISVSPALTRPPEQETLSRLFSLYIRDVASGRDILDSHWLGRLGIALALHSLADVLRAKDLPVVMTFLISRALADPNADVRGRMVNAGIMIIDKHGKDNVSLLFPVFENDLNKKLDRFIPSRSAMDLDFASYMLLEARKGKENPTSLTKEAYLAQVFNMNTTRILAFKNKPPRVAQSLFPEPALSVDVSKPVKPRRSIPRTSEST